MQLLKWFAVPAVVLFVAATLAIAGWLEHTWVCVLFTFSNLAALFRWRRATYRLEGSIQNVDHERHTSEGQRIFKTIFVVTFTSSILLLIGALLVLLLVPAAGTASGGALTINVMVWCYIVKFGAMNVLANHLLPTTRPTSPDSKLEGVDVDRG